MERNTTFRKVMNYVAKCESVEELAAISRACAKRDREVRDADRLRRQMERFELLRNAKEIVRDESVQTSFVLGAGPPVFARRRWFVRREHRGRKHRGLFVSAEADTPASRSGWHFLSLGDCLCWRPADAAAEATRASS